MHFHVITSEIAYEQPFRSYSAQKKRKMLEIEQIIFKSLSWETNFSKLSHIFQGITSIVVQIFW